MTNLGRLFGELKKAKSWIKTAEHQGQRPMMPFQCLNQV